MTSKNGNGDDGMAPIRYWLKFMRAWPENQTTLQRYMSYLNFPIYSILYIPFMFLYVVIDGPSDGVVPLFQGVCDSLAMFTFIVRGILIFYFAKDVYKLSELSKSCKVFEENHKKVVLKAPRYVWCPSATFFVQLCISCTACTSALWSEVEERKATVPLLKSALRNDYLFYPMIILVSTSHIPVWITTTTSDALIISMSTTIRAKAEAMKIMLQDFAKIQVHSQQNAELKKIIIYHNIIATLRNETERINNYQMLLQVFFLVLSLGTPAIRLLSVRDSMGMGDLGFTFCYVIWVIGLLIVYCEMCDSATHACTSLGFASYSAYHPDLSVGAARILVLIMARAQRPTDLTARKLIKINRKTLLKICRRSYSLYSAVLNMK